MRVGNKVSMGEEEDTPHGRKLRSLTIPPFVMAMVTFNTKKKSYPFFFKKKKGIRTGSSLSSALAKKEITHKVGNRKILSKRLIFNRSATCQKSEIRLLFLLPSPRSGEKKLGQISFAYLGYVANIWPKYRERRWKYDGYSLK